MWKIGSHSALQIQIYRKISTILVGTPKFFWIAFLNVFSLPGSGSGSGLRKKPWIRIRKKRIRIRNTGCRIPVGTGTYLPIIQLISIFMLNNFFLNCQIDNPIKKCRPLNFLQCSDSARNLCASESSLIQCNAYPNPCLNEYLTFVSRSGNTYVLFLTKISCIKINWTSWSIFSVVKFLTVL